jgi:hypothetical protein
MRASLHPFLVFSAILTLAVACGGKTAGVGGGQGSSSGGGSSGGSSSGASSSGSGGGSGSSSGAGSSGSSSGGVTCAPLPGCDSSVECPAPGGCGGSCDCEDGQWLCTTGTGCGDDVSDASLPDSPDQVCPDAPPPAGSACYPDGMECGWGTEEGCGESCFCSNGTWECAEDPCTAPVCPVSAPTGGTACSGIGSDCSYPVGFCGEEDCSCDPSGIWSCVTAVCVDAGPPDTGTPDTGAPEDAGLLCPPSEPASGTGCPDLGNVCTYYTPCETNCLCTSAGWVCATEQGCSLPP